MKQHLLTASWHLLIYYFWNCNKSLIYSFYSTLSTHQYLNILYFSLLLTAYSSHFLTSKQLYLACQFLIYLLNPIQSFFRSFLIYLSLIFSILKGIFYSLSFPNLFNSLKISVVVFILANIYPDNNVFCLIYLFKRLTYALICSLKF